MAEPKPRIGIIGSGAIGGFYGGMLARAGFEVHFLLRSEYAAVKAQGLLINSRDLGELRLEKVHAYQRVEEMPACDWLLVGAKSTSKAAIAPLLVQAAAPGAKILLLQNGLGVEDLVRPFLPASLHLLGGLCFIGVQRKEPGVIEHLGYGEVRLGYHSGPAADATTRQNILEEGSAFFTAAGIKCPIATDLVQARWQKLVWNMAYNGLSVLLDCGTARLTSDPDSRELVRDIMREVMAGAACCGHALPPGLEEQMLATTERLPDYLPSMYLDHAQHRAMELEAIYAAPLAAVRQAGGAMPKIEALHQALRFIESRDRETASARPG